MRGMELVEFLLARIGEDEATARGAVDPDRPGTHWQWVTDANDTVVAPGDLAVAQRHQTVSLRTVEEADTQSAGPLPAFITGSTDVYPGGGEHIVRWDPARVLAECEAKRTFLTAVLSVPMWPSVETGLGVERAICALALPYADHEDYDPEWKP